MSHLSDETRTSMPLSLTRPLIVGLGGFILLFALIGNGTVQGELLVRYLAGHPVSKVTTALFLVGLASLGFIAWDVVRQRRLLRLVSLRQHPGAVGVTEAETSVGSSDESGPDATISDAVLSTAQLQAQLESYPGTAKRTWLWRRLRRALEFIQRNDGADGLDDELKYAAELDGEEKHDRYAFARIMIWAIPMLGFLGTVLGISEALGGLELGDDNDFQSMMAGLRGSLYVAFDTTALALTFAIVLMFTQFAIDRAESRLLEKVELRARQELSRHWEITNQAKDTYVQAVESIGASLLSTTERLVERQTKLWRASFDAAESAWVDSLGSARDAVQSSIADAISESVTSLQQGLFQAIEGCDESVTRRWDQWQSALAENARLLVEHQSCMVEQAESLGRVLDHLRELSKTREALSEFLESHPTGTQFADASDSLATAVRLLEYRMSELKSTTPQEPQQPRFQAPTISIEEARKSKAA